METNFKFEHKNTLAKQLNDNDLFEENETILYTYYILYYYKKFDIRVSEQIIKKKKTTITSERERERKLNYTLLTR